MSGGRPRTSIGAYGEIYAKPCAASSAGSPMPSTEKLVADTQLAAGRFL
jgi:hypothetical protein